MDKLTEERQRELWEMCGFMYPEGFGNYTLPKIILSNLIKWVVPVVMAKVKEGKGSAQIEINVDCLDIRLKDGYGEQYCFVGYNYEDENIEDVLAICLYKALKEAG